MKDLRQKATGTLNDGSVIKFDMRKHSDGQWWPVKSDEPLRRCSKIVLADGTVVKDRDAHR